jgi:nitrite reductase/ring-hydroxylating ferredoxin subunit
MTEAKPPEPWWAIARSEEVSGSKPLSVDIADQPIVLWRDRQGIVRALEDRCPHRRAPLSLGCVRDNGWLQCGYHGWSYDGATGRLVEIPSMKDKQKFPPHYKAMPFAVREAGGFVRVCLNGAATAAATPDSPIAPIAIMSLSGTTYVGVAHEHYVAALFDAPGLLISLRGIEFTPYLMSELHVANGQLSMERSCQWRGLHWPAPFSSEFPVTVLSTTHPLTGETELTLRDAGCQDYLRVLLAPVPAARGATAVRWRAEVIKTYHGVRGLMHAFTRPLIVHSAIDAAALRVLKPTVSLHGAQLRTKLGTTNVAIAA